jgi:hypothetical protein
LPETLQVGNGIPRAGLVEQGRVDAALLEQRARIDPLVGEGLPDQQRP